MGTGAYYGGKTIHPWESVPGKCKKMTPKWAKAVGKQGAKSHSVCKVNIQHLKSLLTERLPAHHRGGARERGERRYRGRLRCEG